MTEIEKFKGWLDNYINHFNYKPIIIKDEPDYLEIQFEGLIETVLCSLTQHFVTVWYLNAEEKSDILFEVDFPLFATTAEGLYYCNECENSTYFKSIDEFYKAHTFDYLLLWINSLEPSDKIRVLDGSKYGFFCAQLKEPKSGWTSIDIEPLYIPIVKGE